VCSSDLADNFYGGEGGNETFFLFPSDVIASQYDFAFNWSDGNFINPVARGESQWNDVFVWPKDLDNPGISIDSGIVFLPETTSVDSETGSKYASEIRIVDGKEKRVMVEDKALIRSFIAWGKENINSGSELYRAAREYCCGNYNDDFLETHWVGEVRKKMEEMGFSLDVSSQVGRILFLDLGVRAELTDELVDKILVWRLKEGGGNWKRAEDTVPAKDYWESYFEKNPHLRPKHIQYYDGDPTSAIYKFQQKNGVGKADTSVVEGDFLGFDDHHITMKGGKSGNNEDRGDPRAWRGYDELFEMSSRLITENYRQEAA